MTGFGYNINGFGVSGVAETDRAGSVYLDGDAVVLLENEAVSGNDEWNIGSSEAFCLEAWVNFDLSESYNNVFSSWEGANSYLGILFHVLSDGKIFLGYSAWTAESSGVYVAADTWTHVAITRNAGDGGLFFIRGIAAGTWTNGGAIGGRPMHAGANMDSGGDGNYRPTGYISNGRIVIGEQVYTGAFTPPTTALTLTSQGVTSSNVAFLGFQSTTDFTANETNITVSGVAAASSAPAASNQTPF